MEDLVSKIIYYSEHYYSGNPLVSDEYFDGLVEKLQKLNPKHPILTTPNWGAVDPGAKKPHFGGLVEGIKNKVKYRDEKTKLNKLKGVVTPKYDGMSVVITSISGSITALTRNNGELGVDITENIRYMLDNYATDFRDYLKEQKIISIRCEVLTNKFFESMLHTAGITAFRNFSTGKLLSRKPEDKEHLRVLCIKPLFIRFSTKKFDSYVEMQEEMDHFSLLTAFQEVKSEELEPIYKKWDKQFYIDGLVYRENKLPEPSSVEMEGIKVYDYSNEENTSAIAIKFARDTVKAEVEKVVWSLSKGNRMIPVVHIKPIQLGGVTISKATGFNADFVMHARLTPGTIINITRSNDVIPHIVSVDSLDREEIELPVICPSCEGDLVWSGVHLCCENIWCNLTGLVENIITYVPTPDFVGLPTLIKCYDTALFSHKNVLEYLKNTSLEPLGEGKIRQYAEEHKLQLIEAFQSISYEDFWRISNIPSLGKKIAKKLADVPPDLHKITVFDLGDRKVPRNIRHAIKLSHKEYILELSKFFIVNGEIQHEERGHVVITGKLSRPRGEIERDLEKLGFSVSTAVKSAECLICNEPTNSSKFQKAEKFGVPVLSEEDFFKKYREEL